MIKPITAYFKPADIIDLECLQSFLRFRPPKMEVARFGPGEVNSREDRLGRNTPIAVTACRAVADIRLKIFRSRRKTFFIIFQVFVTSRVPGKFLRAAK